MYIAIIAATVQLIDMILERDYKNEKEIKKDPPKETWIEGYHKHKKDYDKWKKERCPHN